MKVTVCANPSAKHQVEHQRAMVAGLAAHGIEGLASHGNRVSTEHVAVWGWRHGAPLRAAGHKVLVMERGYLGDRFAWTSLAWNGLNGRGHFGQPMQDDGARFRDHHPPMKPWKTGGEYVLILGQVPGDQSLQGRDLGPWYTWAAMQAQNAYELPVMFRAHPLAARKGYKQAPNYTHPMAGTLEDALAKAAVAITWNSNAGVDAVVAGVPLVTMDEGSMAREVSSHRIGAFVRPDRSAWAHRLAWKQWTLAEIASGHALTHLLESEAAHV